MRQQIRPIVFAGIGLMVLCGEPATSQAVPPPCWTLQYPIAQDAPAGCGSYTNCPNATQCVDGYVYQNCPIADCTWPRICKNYISGTYNPVTKQCKGGTFVEQYQDGTFCYMVGAPPLCQSGPGEP